MQYRKTFYSFGTGAHMTRKAFLEGTDVMKADIFANNKTIWWPIRDKITAWVNAEWARWEEEKPDWFTDQWKASVPEDMKPAKKMEDFDGEEEKAAEIEGDEDLIVGGKDEQIGRGRSILEFISGQKAASSKVMPAGAVRNEFDEAEFVTGIRRIKSVGM